MGNELFLFQETSRCCLLPQPRSPSVLVFFWRKQSSQLHLESKIHTWRSSWVSQGAGTWGAIFVSCQSPPLLSSRLMTA